MVGQVVGYGRISSVTQNEARQVEALATCDRVFMDTVSGKNIDRPELQAVLGYVREGDTLRVPSMDRLARNLEDLLSLVRGLTERGVRVEFIKEGQTFTGEDSPMATLLLSLLGAVASFERSLIRERQAEGIALAKERGVYRGRSKALSAEQVTEAQERINAGVPKSVVARDLGISRQTLYNSLTAQYLNTAARDAG